MKQREVVVSDELLTLSSNVTITSQLAEFWGSSLKNCRLDLAIASCIAAALFYDFILGLR